MKLQKMTMCLMSIVIICLSVGWYLDHDFQTNKLAVLEDKVFNTLVAHKTEKETLQARYVTEKEGLQNRIRELTANDDRLVSDIRDYIKTYYRHIPNIVAEKTATEVRDKSAANGVPLVVTVAMTEVESRFDPTAVSPKGARGLMQVMPKIWLKELNIPSKYDLHNIDIGVDAGTKVLKRYLKETGGDMKKALYKYVGGDNSYVNEVYKAMGKFVVFRSLVDQRDEEDEEKLLEVVKITPAGALEPFVHKVKIKGETLGLIAKWYTGSPSNWQAIHKANPEIDVVRMKIGQNVYIPANLLKNVTPLTAEYVTNNGK